mmetsp:Transcript_9750/g.25943  ORF Transcript_9750/g.25943 Transcript_9750/m.25943 type:complete len:90 (-) Transcript_9750:156-425(-)|eukprot:777991-Prymnesium_polylepis.1
MLRSRLNPCRSRTPSPKPGNPAAAAVADGGKGTAGGKRRTTPVLWRPPKPPPPMEPPLSAAASPERDPGPTKSFLRGLRMKRRVQFSAA